MKKVTILIFLVFFLTSCGPTTAQVEEAIEQTKVAQPTNTEVPEPTNTPTIEPSPTVKPSSAPNFEFLQGLTSEDVINIFEEIGANCGDQVKESDGSYSQECSGSLSDGMVVGQIRGESEDTVYAYFVMFVQYKDKDIQEETEDVFLEMANFGSHSNEMQSWVTANLPKIQSSDEELELSTEIDGVILMLSGNNEVLTFLIMPSR